MERKVLKQINELYRGSSFPTRVETTDGETLVLKMRGAGNGLQSLVAEYIVNRITYLAGWNVPNAFVIEIPDNYPWQFGTDEFDDIVQKSYGLNLGLEYIPFSKPCSSLVELPFETRQQIVTLDAFFGNYDRTSVSDNLLFDSKGKIWLIDHGSCRKSLGSTEAKLARNHILSGQEATYFSEQLLKEISNTQVLKSVLNELPSDWKALLG